jgi:isoleucyl-tRNA synthetase
MIDLSKREEEILEYWKAKDTLNKVRAKNKGGKPFYFLDGPPFVSGDLHPAQIWTKTLKDVAIRYKRYRGFDVVDRAGYDVHGLPVENRVEKELSLQSKKDIEEKIGVEKFVRECRAYVERYIGRMDADYERFGISLDFKNPYLPYKNEYIETAWRMFKAAAEKGFLYSGKRTLIYCPHCETPLSQGSMEVEYRDVDDPSIYLIFKIDDKKSKLQIDLGPDTYLAVWTTTPWTIPANVAVAVNPKKLYLLVKVLDKKMIIAKERMEAFAQTTGSSVIVLKEFFGNQLDGTYYISPLEDKVPMQKKLRQYHRVIFSENLVSMGEGTGLVHLAPGNGVDDFVVGKMNKLPVFSPVNSDASYSEEAGEYKGIMVPADANKIVMEDLVKSGAMLIKGSVRHSYPYCWRCGSKLIFLATDQWFMNIQKIKKKLIKQNEKVSWHPEEVKEWQKAVLENSPDWCISRQRYWGIPMPIWICKSCKGRKIIGSIEELKASAVSQEEVKILENDLHRPYIDRIKLKCECGGEMERIKDILDGWFDSGITFRASLSEEEFNELFPVDLIVEYVEQIRAWFQYLMKCGVMVYGKIPFKHVMVHGIMAGTDGRKMSKSFGNYKPLNEITKIFGADAFRLWSVDHQPILNRNLSELEIKESQKMIIMLHNISSLMQEYQDAFKYKPKPGKRPSLKNLSEVDRWMLSRTESIVSQSTGHLDAFEPYKAAVVIKNFVIDDFSRFYLKIAKKRMLYAGRREIRTILDTIDYSLFRVLICASVITPFVTESVYRERYGTQESIFLENWPKSADRLIERELEGNVMIAQDTITAVLNARERADAKLRQPLASAVIEVNTDNVSAALQKMTYLIEDYTNIRKVEVKVGTATGKEVRPNFGGIGPEFKENAGAVAEALRAADANEMLKSIEASGHYSLHTSKGTFNISEKHFTIIEKATDEKAMSFKYGLIHLNTEISEELREDALIREFERRIQVERKGMKLKKADKIKLYCELPPDVLTILNKNKEKVRKDLNAEGIYGLESDMDSKEFEMDGEKIKIGIVKI